MHARAAGTHERKEGYGSVDQGWEQEFPGERAPQFFLWHLTRTSLERRPDIAWSLVQESGHAVPSDEGHPSLLPEECTPSDSLEIYVPKGQQRAVLGR